MTTGIDAILLWGICARRFKSKNRFLKFYFTGFLQSFYRVSRGLPYWPYHKPPEVSSGFFPGYKRVFTGFPISIQGSMSFNSSIDGFYRVLLGFTGFYRISGGSSWRTAFPWMPTGCTGFSTEFPGFHFAQFGFRWVLPGLYRVPLRGRCIHHQRSIEDGFFRGFERVFIEFPISVQGSMSFNSSIDGFYRVLLGFTGFYRVSRSFSWWTWH